MTNLQAQYQHSTRSGSLGVCRRLYNFLMGIMSSRTVERIGNNKDSEIKIEFSNVTIEQGEAQKSKKKKKKKTKLVAEQPSSEVGDENGREEERLPPRVFANIDERSEAFIRSRLEAMRKAHDHNIGPRML